MNPRPLLILDLDETLIFSSPQDDNSRYDFGIPGHQVVKRPGLDNFLSLVAKHFILAVWSSPTEDYLMKIKDIPYFRQPEKRNWRTETESTPYSD